jgi:predicted RNA-binding protein with PIN domain
MHPSLTRRAASAKNQNRRAKMTAAVPALFREMLWQYMAMPYWFDGNNLIGQSVAAARTDSRTRQAFVSALMQYHRAGGGKFLVYFDGDDVSRSASPPGISIRYSAPVSTDQAIVQRLRDIRNPSEVIVVTNDRALMTRCKSEGAAGMTWHEFTSKMRSRRVTQTRTREPKESVDVDEWMRYFGITDSE